MDRQLVFELGCPLENRTESERKEGASNHIEVAADNEHNSKPTQPSLLEQILDRANLNAAYKHVKGKGGSPGIDGMNVRTELGDYLKENKEEILDKIRNRKYKPKPVKRVLIPKDKPGEFRKLGIPTGKDRVIQQAIAQVLTPIYEPLFSDNSFGFRPNRSCHKALKRVGKYASEGYVYAVSLDLAKYFDTVPQMKLIEILQRTIKDNDVISLIHKFLKAGVIEEGLFQRTEEGMPQGGPLSPLLSNIMLNELDQELEKRGLKFVRYADDTIILCKSKKAAERVRKSIIRFIEEVLKLKVNRDKTVVAHIEDVKYLGYSFYLKDGRCRFRIHPKSMNKIKNKLKDLFKKATGMSYKDLIVKLKQILTGWVNYFYLADCKTFLTQLDQWIRRRFRMLIWRRWKRVRTRYRNFRALGLSHENALRGANSRKGPWRSSNNPQICAALTNDILERWGYISALDIYLSVRQKKIDEFNLRYQRWLEAN